MSAKKPKSIRSVLLGQSPELSALVKKAQVQVTLRDQVASVLSEPMCRHVVAARLEDETLTVLCDSAPWAARVRFYAQTMLQNLASDHNLEASSLIVKVRPPIRPGE